jgi:hypothetical protein
VYWHLGRRTTGFSGVPSFVPVYWDERLAKNASSGTPLMAGVRSLHSGRGWEQGEEKNAFIPPGIT